MLSFGESSFKHSFRIYKFLNLFCNSLHALLVLVSFVVGDAVDSEINRSFEFLFRSIAPPWCIWVRVPGLQITLGFLRYWISNEPVMVWVLLLVVLEVWAVLQTILFPLSLTTFTTHSFGTDWYVIMASEPVCQNSRPASCAVDKWIQYTVSCSGLHWLWYCTFLGFLRSLMDSASSASLLKGSRGVKKIVCLPSLRSFPPAN